MSSNGDCSVDLNKIVIPGRGLGEHSLERSGLRWLSVLEMASKMAFSKLPGLFGQRSREMPLPQG